MRYGDLVLVLKKKEVRQEYIMSLLEIKDIEVTLFLDFLKETFFIGCADNRNSWFKTKCMESINYCSLEATCKCDIHAFFVFFNSVQNNLMREIRHFWFTSWSVDSVPEPVSVIKLILDTRVHYEDSGAPLIVHCR